MSPKKKSGKKKAAKRKTRPKASSLGSGGAFQAASAMEKSRARRCTAMGGKWSGGQCKY